jgi:dTDP-4-dehydrorhamnose 3,5-epimerase
MTPSGSGPIEVPIPDVEVTPLSYHHDARGWLVEIYREDEITVRPAMAYVSLTHPGVARGPHEHRDQADVFVFMGPSTFRVYVWDNRSASPTCGQRAVFEVGAERPARVVVPAGVVHAYKNVGDRDGWVINCPDRLYAGRGRREPVDEIRWEDEPSGRFRLD